MFGKEKLPDRFICKSSEGSSINDFGQRMVLVDRETGVNYMFMHCGYAGGMTVLLDADGKPIVTPVTEE